MIQLENIIKIVKLSSAKLFAVTINGEVKVKRLFVSYRGFLCEYAKGDYKRGHRIADFHLKKWENIKPIY